MVRAGAGAGGRAHVPLADDEQRRGDAVPTGGCTWRVSRVFETFESARTAPECSGSESIILHDVSVTGRLPIGKGRFGHVLRVTVRSENDTQEEVYILPSDITHMP